MLLKSWLSNLHRRFRRPSHRLRKTGENGTPRIVAADVRLPETQALEARELLSGVLTDTTPVTVVNAAAGINTGNIVLATFKDAIPPGGLTSTFSVPGATETNVAGFSGNELAGTYDNSTCRHGFLYDGSTVTSFDAPGDIWFGTSNVISGKYVVGNYEDAHYQNHGFLFNGSTVTTIDPPARDLSWQSTEITGISGANVVGQYLGAGGRAHGFLYNASTGIYTTLDVAGYDSSTAAGVSGQTVVGTIWNSNVGGSHGFIYDGSKTTLLDAPGGHGTNVSDISGKNIVGTYETGSTRTDTRRHGFLYDGSTFTTIDVPGAVNTYPNIVSGNTVIGEYDSIPPGSAILASYDYSNSFRFDGTTFTTTITSGPRVIAWNAPPPPTYGTWYQAAPLAGDFMPTVNWGGPLIGTPTVSVQLVSQSASGSTWQVVGSATYADNGYHAIAVTVSDPNANVVSTSNTSISVQPFAGQYSVSIAGNNSPPTLATIVQSGSQLTLIGSTVALATVGGPTQLKFGATTATYGSSTITFGSTGPFANQVLTKLDLPTDYTTALGAATHVNASGNSLTFVNEFGVPSAGFWTSPTQVTAFGLTAAVGHGKLTWSNGTVWYENVSLNGTRNGTDPVNISARPSELTVVDYVNLAGRSVHLIETGTTSAVFVDSLGRMTVGSFFSPNQATTNLYPNDVATIVGGVVLWQDGSVWIKASTPSTQITVTDYLNSHGVATHVIRNGTANLAFDDSLGYLSLGTFINSTQAVAYAYPGDLATFDVGTVTWQDGMVWQVPIYAIPAIVTIGGPQLTFAPPPLPLTVTASTSNTPLMHFEVFRTDLRGLDGPLQGTYGTRLDGTITWSNGDVWTGFDINSLNAFFELSST